MTRPDGTPNSPENLFEPPDPLATASVTATPDAAGMASNRATPGIGVGQAESAGQPVPSSWASAAQAAQATEQRVLASRTRRIAWPKRGQAAGRGATSRASAREVAQYVAGALGVVGVLVLLWMLIGVSGR